MKNRFSSHAVPAALRSRASTCRGFTLIELLTVIAIIGILAAIIIPIVGSARKTAQRATCVGNLRDVGTAVIAYANDNRNRLPGPLGHSMSNTYTYSGASYDLDTTSPTLANHLAHYLKLPTTQTPRYAPQFLCPAWHAAVGGKEPNDNSYRNDTWRGNTIFGKRGGNGNPADSKPRLITDVLSPSTSYIVTELEYASNHEKTKLPYNYHGNFTRSTVYMDGHVVLLKYEIKRSAP